MKTRIASLIIAAFAVAVCGMGADHIVKGTRIPVNIEMAATAAQQLAHCEKLIGRLRGLAENERQLAAIEAFANLDVIPKRFPNDADAILQSYLLKDEAARAARMLGNSKLALTQAAPLSTGTKYRPTIEQRLGEVFDRLGDAKTAAEHFRTAEQSLQIAGVTPEQAGTVLNAAAFFYHNQSRAQDAIRCYRTAAHWNNQSNIARASYLLSSMREALSLKDAAQARRDADEIERTIEGSKRPEDQNLLSSLRKEVNRMRAEHHVY